MTGNESVRRAWKELRAAAARCGPLRSVSLAVIASAAAVAVGADIADPLIGLAIKFVILRITWQSWQTVRSQPPG